MGGGHSLHATINISGNVDSSVTNMGEMFDQWGDTLLNLGNYINPLSQDIIGFGKESVAQFASFEDVMLKIKSVGELTDKEMHAVEEAARQMGATTRYTAQDAGEAALFLTQVGLGYQEVIDLMPAVLRGAQAGDISIANAADYVYSSLKSMGLGLENADMLIDMMAKTASVGSTDFDTLGESITRMGSAVQLIKGGPEQVMTILSAMSEFGADMRGAEGGTALRNFFLSLAAPAGGRKEVLAMLEAVGSSVEELDEVMEGVELTSAAAAIKELDLQVYDSAGNLNNGIDIIRSLRDSMEGLNEEQQKKTLSQIFGKRTITTAMNLIKMTDDEWNNLMADIKDSDGYAQYMADTQESGLGGALRVLKSQFEELQLTAGKALKEPIMDAAEGIGDIILWLTSLDDTTTQNVVTALGAVAAAGPGMLLVGGALKAMAFLLTPTGAIAGGVILLGALAGILHNLEEASISNSFGTMEMDMESLRPYIAGLSTEFSDAVASMDQYSSGIDKAVESYQTASSTFSSELLKAAITGSTLTPEDIASLTDLGGQMLDATIEGITLKRQESGSFLDALFKNPEDAETKQNILDVQGGYFDGLISEAAQIGQAIRDEMTAALRDGTLDANDRAAIMAQVQRLNEIEAQIAAGKNQIEFEKMLHKGQSLGLDGLYAFNDEMTAQRDKEVADAHDAYETERATTKVAYDDKIKNAQTPEEKERYIAAQKKSLDAMDREWKNRETEIHGQYAGGIAEAWSETLKDSDYGGMYRDLLGFVDELMTGDAGMAVMGDWLMNHDEIPLFDKLGEVNAALGGRDGMIAMLDMFEKTGSDVPDWMTTMADLYLAMETAQGMQRGDDGSGIFTLEDFDEVQDIYQRLQALREQSERRKAEQAAGEGMYGSNLPRLADVEKLAEEQGITYGQAFTRATMHDLGLVDEAGNALYDATGKNAEHNAEMMQQALIEYETVGKVGKETTKEIQQALLDNGYELLKFGADGVMGDETIQAMRQYLDEYDKKNVELEVQTDVDETGIEEARELASEPQTMPIETEVTGGEMPTEGVTTEQAIDIAVNPPDTAPLTQAIDSVDGKTVTTNVNADASSAESTISGLSGHSATVKLNPDASAITSLLSSGFSATVHLSYDQSGKPAEFATGGRATEASIFGEGGTAEWAIPEEHTQNTKNLLMSAAEASGFSWAELWDDADDSSGDDEPSAPIIINYMPVIHAENADGVEEKLIEDKKRLFAMLKEQQQIDERMGF